MFVNGDQVISYFFAGSNHVCGLFPHARNELNGLLAVKHSLNTVTVESMLSCESPFPAGSKLFLIP